MYITLFKTVTHKPEMDYLHFLSDNQETTTVTYKTTFEIEKKALNELSANTRLHLHNVESALNEIWALLRPYENNYEQQYYTFKIPKRSGGLRTINAPLPEFKEALSKTKDIFEQKIKCLPHDSAYAYIKHKCTIDALIKHKENESHWFLKIDLKDFFPNCTPTLIMQQLMQLYPFAYLTEEYQTILKNIIKVCCLNNGLPQGTPMSPLLTNLIMVPYDYKINNYLKRGTGNHYIYTRYADDMLISAKGTFDWKAIEQYLQTTVAPFKVNTTKTRYGSRSGQNWNLGLMLNKDNNITLGHQKKKQLKATLYNFLKDFKANRLWQREDVYSLQGELSYLRMVEPKYYDYLLEKYQNTCQQNFKQAVKATLNPEI